MKKITITQDISGQRLDKFLARCLGAAPKTFIYKMLRKKNIVVNGKRADGALILSAGDVVTLYLAEGTIAKFTKAGIAHDGPVDIIFEDENIIIVNKSANLLTQPDAPGGDSLIGRLRHRHADAAFAPVAINRLDRNTTGIVLCAKNLAAAQILAKLVHDRQIEKSYLAVAHGEISREMRLEGLHTKDAVKNLAEIVPRGTLGRKAVTKLTPIEYHAEKNVTMLKIGLETGRGHQIRAHLAAIGHPLVGDTKYGGRGAARQMLHAHEIAFGEIGGCLEYLCGRRFVAPLPKDML
ncbi:MAG: RluA family pseudouridine synthase [Clostridiales bacterium]|jgi:23S rRNA pseudouridine955/2504/2580 synthase|nr:RluA family pseudouridine synthase [Clostridiales bacterium]